MCDFHSCVIFRDGKLFHIPENSHSGAVAKYGRVENTDLDRRRFWEWEWSGEGNFDLASNLRGYESAPNRVTEIALHHAKILKEALSEGKHFDGYFADSVVWGDVWIEAMNRGHALAPIKLGGNLIIGENFKGDLSKLQSVGGDLNINANAKLDALQSVGGDLYINANAKLDALQSVGGYLNIYANAKLDAPELKKVNGKKWKQPA
jgi:hypothetical protein